MDEIQMAWKYAWSLRADMETVGMKFLGIITRNGKDYLFYKDQKGDYWFDSKPEGREKSEWQQRAEHEARRRRYHGKAG